MIQGDLIVLGSLSLRGSEVGRTSATNNDVLETLSLRRAQMPNPAVTDTKVLKHVSMPIAGFQHSGGNWSYPEDLSYVVVHM